MMNDTKSDTIPAKRDAVVAMLREAADHLAADRVDEAAKLMDATKVAFEPVWFAFNGTRFKRNLAKGGGKLGKMVVTGTVRVEGEQLEANREPPTPWEREWMDDHTRTTRELAEPKLIHAGSPAMWANAEAQR